MLLRSRLLVLAYLLAVMLPIFGGVFQGTADAATAPTCYLQVNGNSYTKQASCDVTKLPGGKIDGNEGKCFVASGSSAGVSNYAEKSCSELEASSQGLAFTNPAGSCGENEGCSCDSSSGDCIIEDIKTIVNVLAVGVGVIATIVLMVAGLQYMTARDNPQMVQAAKIRILNVVIAVVAFAFIYAFLQWVVPGGAFSAALPGHVFLSGGRV